MRIIWYTTHTACQKKIRAIEEKKKANSIRQNRCPEVGLKIKSVAKYLMLRGERGLEGVALKMQTRRIYQTVHMRAHTQSQCKYSKAREAVSKE